MPQVKPSITIEGHAYFSDKTKELVKWMPSEGIAVIQHQDIDEMAAISFVQKNVKAVLNLSSSMSGQYPSSGTKQLLDANIPVFDVLNKQEFKDTFKQGCKLNIVDETMIWQGQSQLQRISPVLRYTDDVLDQKEKLAKQNLVHSLRAFTENTLSHAYREMDEILKTYDLPLIANTLRHRHVVVVTRGSGYIEDLRAIHGYIQEKKPVLIGVDGGADAIIECGYQPDIIFGDMDSVSEEALQSGANVVVHAYPNGYAPGLEVIKAHGLQAHLFPCFGTSEDAAQLLAYEAGAVLIVTLGSHTNMFDFLEKGRKGMGSTLLVRLKIGEKLVDAKGVRLLYPHHQVEKSGESTCILKTT
ncbi:putative cytokinetic ring protein SteA [Caldalkalibacillus salinus]|uniref:putative cytokinetic ring protein SteA n=1 Tax=Caldalkalibacillus salinus TaxID=2803787 RepID=UPI001921F2B5|nr:putative cytokinetic ring protein SteA [Caldalkalibacillus salinus]